MNISTLLILSLGLAMDAFAVSVCKGLAIQKLTWKRAAIVGGWFGGFQALMPTIGYVMGIQFKSRITSIDHWIAFVLLGIIGINMIREAFSKKEEEENDNLSIRTMFVLAIATSIDALAIGITLAFLEVNILAAAAAIGIITFIISITGVKIGHVFGTKYKSKAELAGGVILIMLGFKILFEHLNV